MSNKSIPELLETFISGQDRSLTMANRLEVALDEAWPIDDGVQKVVEMLAAYRPCGGEFLFNEEQLTCALQQLRPRLLKH